MKEKKSKRLVFSESKSQPAVLREAAVPAMGPVVTVRDAKAHLSELLEWVSGGREITITSAGRPKARLVAASPEPPRKVFRGMGEFLLGQPIHSGLTADELIHQDRDSRGW
jgi:prevent-host-death family protein